MSQRIKTALAVALAPIWIMCFSFIILDIDFILAPYFQWGIGDMSYTELATSGHVCYACGNDMVQFLYNLSCYMAPAFLILLVAQPFLTAANRSLFAKITQRTITLAGIIALVICLFTFLGPNLYLWVTG